MKRFTFRATQIWLLPRKEMVYACPGCTPPEAHHPGMSRAHHRTPPETQVQPSLAPTFLSAGDVQSRGSLAHSRAPPCPQSSLSTAGQQQQLHTANSTETKPGTLKAATCQHLLEHPHPPTHTSCQQRCCSVSPSTAAAMR